MISRNTLTIPFPDKAHKLLPSKALDGQEGLLPPESGACAPPQQKLFGQNLVRSCPLIFLDRQTNSVVTSFFT